MAQEPFGEICTDNRFWLIDQYKKKLIESTNIETSPKEMAVLDNILFRFWQMGWLIDVPHGRIIDADKLINRCRDDALTDDQKDFCKKLEYAISKTPVIMRAVSGE